LVKEVTDNFKVQGKTGTVIIAQLLITIANANAIFVIEN
jgi:ABC-type transport system involved in Fe-S cluster assembly fused permease/ATPase subunit